MWAFSMHVLVYARNVSDRHQGQGNAALKLQGMMFLQNLHLQA